MNPDVQMLSVVNQEVKKINSEAVVQDEALRKKFSLDLDLVAEDNDDARIAALIQYSTVECKSVSLIITVIIYYSEVLLPSRIITR